MSGHSPAPDPMADGSGGDPSMEDILASIRRILNEDEAAPLAVEEPPPPEPEPVAATEEDDVLVLDTGMLVAPPEPEPAPEPEPEPFSPPLPPLEPPPPLQEPSYDGGLLGAESAAAASSAVGALLRTLSNERATQTHRGGPTIEDLVREEIRPLLKSWLDQHLPPVVERLVRQEIERVAGRAGL